MFIENFRLNPKEKVDYEGQRLIVREIVKRFATRILQQDKARTPFLMEAVEAQGLLYNLKIDHAPGHVVIGGMIDRIDRKDNELRIIDYKTGRDKLEFDSLDSLFERDKDRNKAAFQTFLYALLYKANSQTQGMTVLPGLMNRDFLFGKNTDFGFKLKKGDVVQATDQVMNEFEMHLRKILEEIFNPEEVFDQVQQIEICSYCPYKNICYR